MQNYTYVIFLIFTSGFMYLINLPLREGIFVWVFITGLYKFFFHKIFLHFKTGNLRFDSSDLLVYLLILIMTIFIISIAFIIHPLLAYAMEGLVSLTLVSNLAPLQGSIKLPNSIANSFAFSDVNSSSGGNREAVEASVSTAQRADIGEKNVIVRRLYSVTPSDSHMNINWTFTNDEQVNLDKRFKTELIQFLPTKSHFDVDTSRPTGLLDNNQQLSRTYPSYQKFDEYNCYKITYVQRFKEGLSVSDQGLFRDKFLELKQAQLNTWSQGRLHFFEEKGITPFSKQIMSIGAQDGLNPAHTVPAYQLPRFMTPRN